MSSFAKTLIGRFWLMLCLLAPSVASAITPDSMFKSGNEMIGLAMEVITEVLQSTIMAGIGAIALKVLILITLYSLISPIYQFLEGNHQAAMKAALKTVVAAAIGLTVMNGNFVLSLFQTYQSIGNWVVKESHAGSDSMVSMYLNYAEKVIPGGGMPVNPAGQVNCTEILENTSAVLSPVFMDEQAILTRDQVNCVVSQSLALLATAPADAAAATQMDGFFKAVVAATAKDQMLDYARWTKVYQAPETRGMARVQLEGAIQALYCAHDVSILTDIAAKVDSKIGTPPAGQKERGDWLFQPLVDLKDSVMSLLINAQGARYKLCATWSGEGMAESRGMWVIHSIVQHAFGWIAIGLSFVFVFLFLIIAAGPLLTAPIIIAVYSLAWCTAPLKQGGQIKTLLDMFKTKLAPLALRAAAAVLIAKFVVPFATELPEAIFLKLGLRVPLMYVIFSGLLLMLVSWLAFKLLQKSGELAKSLASNSIGPIIDMAIGIAGGLMGAIAGAAMSVAGGGVLGSMVASVGGSVMSTIGSLLLKIPGAKNVASVAGKGIGLVKSVAGGATNAVVGAAKRGKERMLPPKAAMSSAMNKNQEVAPETMAASLSAATAAGAVVSTPDSHTVPAPAIQVAARPAPTSAGGGGGGLGSRGMDLIEAEEKLAGMASLDTIQAKKSQLQAERNQLKQAKGQTNKKAEQREIDSKVARIGQQIKDQDQLESKVKQAAAQVAALRRPAENERAVAQTLWQSGANSGSNNQASPNATTAAPTGAQQAEATSAAQSSSDGGEFVIQTSQNEFKSEQGSPAQQAPAQQAPAQQAPAQQAPAQQAPAQQAPAQQAPAQQAPAQQEEQPEQNEELEKMRKLVNENQPPKQTEQTPEQIQSKRRSRLLAIKERVAPSLASKAVAAVGGVPSRQGLLGALGALATFGQDPKSNELTAAMKANFNQQYYGKKGRPDTPSEAQEKTRNKAYKKSVDDYLKLEKIVAELKKETETKRVELQDARQPLQKELDGLQRVLREYDEEIAKESDEGRKNYLAVGRAESQNELNAVLDDMTNKEKPLMQLEAECAKRLGIQQSSEADVEKAMIALESQSQALETAEAAAKKEAKGKA